MGTTSDSRADALHRVEICELTELTDLRQCESLQRAVWQASETELVPLSQLRAAQHAGGLVAGARIASELIGFSYAFPALRADRDGCGLHSHMTAVIPGLQNGGVGRALKWFQRRWSLDRGIGWIEWTFDPLRSANARFNLEHLGATAGEYLIDTYGPMQDALNAGLPSDRLMAHWDLAAPHLDHLEDGQPRASPPRQIAMVLGLREDGSPSEPRLGVGDQALGVAVPANLGRLLATAPTRAMSWRTSVRRTLAHYFEAGYRATRFVDGAYLLEAVETAAVAKPELQIPVENGRSRRTEDAGEQ